MKCPSCSKFAAYDTTADPEVEVSADTVDLAEDEKTIGSVEVSGTVRIVLTAECCGDELKESNFDIQETIDVEKSVECTCETWTDTVNVEADGAELTERQESQVTTKSGKIRYIPSRYQRKYFGAALTIQVTCACGKQIGSEDWKDETQASEMDELV